MKTIKIAVTGPEGSGKSILATALARFFNCPLLEDSCEYYFNRNNHDKITPEILFNLAQIKIQKEKELLNNQPPCIVSDGELRMLKIWAEFKFNSCPVNLKKLIDQQHYDLYVLTKPETNPQYPFKREDKTLRTYFLNAYKKELTENDLPYILVEGEFYSRKKEAVNKIESLLKKISS
ncbi:MAG: AAA family ATPase [Candidatus Cyclobacteriaceae bacterium M2_1C_046]